MESPFPMSVSAPHLPPGPSQAPGSFSAGPFRHLPPHTSQVGLTFSLAWRSQKSGWTSGHLVTRILGLDGAVALPGPCPSMMGIHTMESHCCNGGQEGESWADLALKPPGKGAASHRGPIPSSLNPVCGGLRAQGEARPLNASFGSLRGQTKGRGSGSRLT